MLKSGNRQDVTWLGIKKQQLTGCDLGLGVKKRQLTVMSTGADHEAAAEGSQGHCAETARGDRVAQVQAGHVCLQADWHREGAVRSPEGIQTGERQVSEAVIRVEPTNQNTGGTGEGLLYICVGLPLL